jgi:hypothetical protein
VGNQLHEGHYDYVVGNLVERETEGLTLPLHELQIEAAAIYLSPVYAKLRRIGELKQELRTHFLALGQPPEGSYFEMGYRLAEGGFLIIDNQIPYTTYLQNGYDAFPEVSGYGKKEPGEIVVFSELKLRSSELDSKVAVEMEINEFPDKSFAEIILPLSKQRDDSRYTIYNKLIFNPEHQRIGFINYDSPDIEVF